MNDKFVLNYGVRYEFTRPPVAGGDQYSELDPTKPNPGGQRLSPARSSSPAKARDAKARAA